MLFKVVIRIIKETFERSKINMTDNSDLKHTCNNVCTSLPMRILSAGISVNIMKINFY